MAAALGAGQMEMPAFIEASDVARKQLEGVTKQLARAARVDPLVDLVGAVDVRKAWLELGLDRQRAVLRSLLDVTILPIGRGRRPDGEYFDYQAIETKWKRGA
jgi:hypothetical protein